MADLNPLIRVRKHAVEQKQKFLAELYRQAEQLAGQKKALEDQLADERQKLEGSNSVDMLKYYGLFAQSVKERVADIVDAMQKLDVRIDIAREDMRESFADLKKIQITQDRRVAEEIAALEKKTAQMLDEIAIDGFMRRQQ